MARGHTVGVAEGYKNGWKFFEDPTIKTTYFSTFFIWNCHVTFFNNRK